MAIDLNGHRMTMLVEGAFSYRLWAILHACSQNIQKTVKWKDRTRSLSWPAGLRHPALPLGRNARFLEGTAAPNIGYLEWRLDFFFCFGSVRLIFLAILSELIGVAVCSVL
jgi:hypothetical protein